MVYWKGSAFMGKKGLLLKDTELPSVTKPAAFTAVIFPTVGQKVNLTVF